MMRSLEQLERNVAHEIEHQTALLELLDRELEALTTGGTRHLEEIHRALEERVRDSATREAERRALVASLGRELGLPSQELTLGRLAEEAGKPGLAERGQQLRSVLRQVQQTHQKTTLLVRHSLQFFHDLVGALGGERDAAATYDAQGRCAPPSGRRLAAEG